MLRQRGKSILADFWHQNDFDTLGGDPVLKLLAGRMLYGIDLASQLTVPRFENTMSIMDLWILRDVLLNVIIDPRMAKSRVVA